MKNLVVIENATIDSLASNPAVASLVPCLKSYKEGLTALKSKSCRKCGKVKGQETNEFYARIKDCLGSTSATGLRPVFELLDARQLRLVTRRGRSNVIKTIRRNF